jgi:ATP dependent DNA ligase domain
MLPRRIRTDGFVDPCIPSRAPKPPSGPDWVHEVKHDGYRLIVRRDGEAVRLFTRRGYDWTDRYPAIASAAGKLTAQSFTLDGEAVVCGADGVAIFDAFLARAPLGIELNEHTDENGAVVFLHACKMGLEGIVSKRLTALPVRPFPGLDQGQEPQQSGDDPGTRAFRAVEAMTADQGRRSPSLGKATLSARKRDRAS